EGFGRDGLGPDQRQLVLDQRVFDDGDAFHDASRQIAQKQVPALTPLSGGDPSARLSRAMLRPADHVPPSRILASGSDVLSLLRRRRSTSASPAGRAIGQARNSTTSVEPTSCSRAASAGSRKTSTPVSMNSPPLRYSASPVRPSISVSVKL